ncbi:caspase family protein [Rhodopseudomonas sp. B29]|uniref:caspase family protein n=1 Tax=Rhodopseudomonas sp. B29 TaxID=95607 RepID=UPI000349D094|nr:caspase family protein [Rhodopseudomonas sp. B29]
MALRFLGIAVAAVALVFGLTLPGLAETRIALVIGNGAYRNIPRLPNPPKDATAVAAALERSGFDTIKAIDLDERGMEDAAIRFAKAARSADVALFYYSGHAMQFNGVNYLAPVDATLTDESDLRRLTRVDEIVADLQQAKTLRILVLDSCRDNPLAEQLRRSIGKTRAIPVGHGLAKVDAPQGMIMAYATQAGHTAEDGDGDNSPYTAAFLKHIEEPEEIGSIFRSVSEDVYETTKHTQLPELSLSIIGRFYLHGQPPAKANGVAPVAAPAPQINPTGVDFAAAVEANTIAAWEEFLSRHPEGSYAELARERKARLLDNDKDKPSRPDAEPTKLAALTPGRGSDPAPAVELPKALQTELRRVGCNTGSVDGKWDATSQEAMKLFNKHAGLKLDVKLASLDALDVVKSRSGRVCPLSCERGYKPDGDLCVKIVCDSGYHLSDDNRCERDAREERRPREAARHPPAVRNVAPAEPEIGMTGGPGAGGHMGSRGTGREQRLARQQAGYRSCMGPLPGCYERAIRRMSPDSARAWCTRKPTC